MRETILIVLFGDVGDTLLTVPAIRSIRRRYPEGRLVLLTSQAAGALLEGYRVVDEIVAVDKHAFDSTNSVLRVGLVVGVLRRLWKLRKEGVETAVVMNHLITWWGTVKFASLLYLLGSRRRIGLDNGRGWFLTERVADHGYGARHEAEYRMDVARALGAGSPIALESPADEQARRAADDLLASLPSERRILAIHPGTGWYAPGRRWPAERFAATVRLLLDEEELACIVVGSQQDQPAAAEVLRALGPCAGDIVGRTSLPELAAVLERCSLLIASDGGVAHLAAAAGIPVVAVFGPSNDRAWRPLTGVVVESSLPCRPCLYYDSSVGKRNGCAQRECLEQITPRMVADAALRLLHEEKVGV